MRSASPRCNRDADFTSTTFFDPRDHDVQLAGFQGGARLARVDGTREAEHPGEAPEGPFSLPERRVVVFAARRRFLPRDHQIASRKHDPERIGLDSREIRDDLEARRRFEDVHRRHELRRSAYGQSLMVQPREDAPHVVVFTTAVFKKDKRHSSYSTKPVRIAGFRSLGDVDLRYLKHGRFDMRCESPANRTL